MSRRPPVRNAVRRTVVEYAPIDPLGVRALHAFAGWTIRAAAGLTGTVYAGSDDDPSRTFTGTVARSPQTFTGAGFLAANRSTFRDEAATIDTGQADGPYADPARRIFAERLLRRQGGLL